MGIKYNINRLHQDELEYELSIRGVAIGTVIEMRKSLSCALRQELRFQEHPYTYEQDKLSIEDKLKEIGPKIEILATSKQSGEYLRLESALAHLIGRVERMKVKGEDQRKVKSEFLCVVLSLMDTLDSRAKHFDDKLKSTPLNLSVFQEHSDLVNSSDDEVDDVRLDASHASGGPTSRSVPVRQWELTFSGDRKGLSLNAFLERVDELCVARNVSEQILFDSAVDLFSGRALCWYRATRKTVRNWKDLVQQLRDEFQPSDYNERLFEEIKKRTQGPDESIGIYLSVMSALFGRLTCPVTEDVQLKMLLRNISPYYQTHLGLVDISSIDQLRSLCRKLETRRECIEKFSNPVRRSQVLEPDLAYCETANTSGNSISSESSGPTGVVICFRCRKPGHRAAGCLERRKLRCFGCQKDGYTIRNCPDCQKRSGNGQGRS